MIGGPLHQPAVAVSADGDVQAAENQGFDAVMQAGRVRGKGKTAPTSIQGVKQIIKSPARR